MPKTLAFGIGLPADGSPVEVRIQVRKLDELGKDDDHPGEPWFDGTYFADKTGIIDGPTITAEVQDHSAVVRVDNALLDERDRVGPPTPRS